MPVFPGFDVGGADTCYGAAGKVYEWTVCGVAVGVDVFFKFQRADVAVLGLVARVPEVFG